MPVLPGGGDEVKDSVLTAKTSVLLVLAALLIAAGAVNFWQRGKFRPPPWDGVTWVDMRVKDAAGKETTAVIAKSVEPGSAAARARLIPGDRLIAISRNGQRCEEVAQGQKCPEVA